MKTMTFASAAAAAVLFMSGCASINSVSLTPIPSQRGKTVRAVAEKTIFLGFNFDNDYVNPLVEDLKRQCPNGLVSGVLTKDEVISYFIVFTHRITATGYCGTSVAKNGTQPGRSAASEQ